MRWIAERRRHALDQLLRRGMLQVLRLVMDAIPRIAEHLGEIALEDAMAAQGAQRGAAPFFRESHAAIRLVRDQTLIGEATHHPADRRGGDVEAQRDLIRRRGLRAALEVVDRLEVILYRA